MSAPAFQGRRLRFEYRLVGSGWALATFSFGRRSAPMVVSYLRDSLGELARAIESLGARKRTASVIFMSEPGEHQVHFKKVAGAKVGIDVVWYPDWRSWGMFDGPGEPTLQAIVSLAELRAQVVAALAKLLARHGTAGYRKRWAEHPFPLAVYKRLAGKSQRPRRPNAR